MAGRHYHNLDTYNQGAEYLNKTLIKALGEKTIELPTEDGKGTEKVSMKDLGISYPTIVRKSPLEDEAIVDPNTEAGGGPPPTARRPRRSTSNTLISWCSSVGSRKLRRNVVKPSRNESGRKSRESGPGRKQ